jgi:muramoyltetrapeptide carboxypeptidase LdcA involved in peptidoglycan recycling
MGKLLKLSKLFWVIFPILIGGCSQNQKEPSGIISSSLLREVDKARLRVVAPASWVNSDESARLKQYCPKIFANLLTQYDSIYAFLSNTDASRFDFFVQALKDTNSKVVWTLRGGYGSGRVTAFVRTYPASTP